MGRGAAGVTVDIGFRVQLNDLFKELKGPLGKLSDLVEGSGLSDAIKDEVKTANTELESLYKDLSDKYDELLNGKMDSSSFDSFKKTTQNRLSELANQINDLTQRFNDFQTAMSGVDAGAAGRGVVELSQKFTEFREQVLGANKLLQEFMNIADKRSQPIQFIDTSSVKDAMNETKNLTRYIDDIEDIPFYDEYKKLETQDLVEKFKQADAEISNLNFQLMDAENANDEKAIARINTELFNQIQIVNSLRAAYYELTNAEYNFADMSNFKNKANTPDRFDTYVADLKQQFIDRRNALNEVISTQSQKSEQFVDVQDFQIKNGSISVPLKLSTTATGLKSEVNGILDAVQSSIKPIEVKFKLTSGYGKYKTDELKEAQDLENQISDLDIPNETKQNLLNLTANIREAFGKELKINIRENSADVANTIKGNIKDLQAELNAQPIEIKLKVDEGSKKQAVEDIIDVKNGSNRKEERQASKLPQLMTNMSQYMNTQGDAKGNGFWEYLQSNLESADGSARKLLTSLGLISKTDKQINVINNGGTNRGGIVGPENTVIARAGTTEKYEEALKLKDALNQASEAGVQCSRILNVVFDKNSGMILELQKTMSGEPISNIGLDGQEKNLKFNEAILKATDEQVLKLITDLETLNKLGINVDFNDSNFLFDEKKGFSFLDLGLKGADSSDFGLPDFTEMLDYIADSFDNPKITSAIDSFKEKLTSVNDMRQTGGANPAADSANNVATAATAAAEALAKEGQAASASTPALQEFAKANDEISKSAELVSTALEKVVSIYQSLSTLDFVKLIDKEQLNSVVIDLEKAMESMQNIFKQFGDQGLSTALSKLTKDQIKGVINNNNLNTTQQGLSKLKKDELVGVAVEGFKNVDSTQQQINTNLNEQLNSLIGIIEQVESSFMEEAKIVDAAMNMNVASVDKVISSLGEFSDWLHLLIDEVQQLQKDNPDFLLPLDNILKKTDELKNLASILEKSREEINNVAQQVGVQQSAEPVEPQTAIVSQNASEIESGFRAATQGVEQFGQTAQKQLEQVDHLEGEVVNDAIAINNAFKQGKETYGRTGNWNEAYEDMMSRFKSNFEKGGFKYQSSSIKVSPDFSEFRGGTSSWYNDELKQGIVYSFKYNKELGEIVQTQIQINDSNKARIQDIEQTIKKVAELKEALAGIEATNKGLDISEQVQNIDDLIFKFANGTTTINEVENAINNLKASISSIKGDLKGGGSSLNEVTNAVNLIRNAENDLASFRLDIDDLIDPPDRIKEELLQLRELLDQIQAYDITNNGINKESSAKIKEYIQLRSQIQNDLKVAKKENANQLVADSFRPRLEAISPTYQSQFVEEYEALVSRVDVLNKEFLEGTDGIKLGVNEYKRLMNEAFTTWTKETRVGIGKNLGTNIVDVDAAKEIAQQYVGQFKTVKKELQFSDTPTADGLYKFSAQVRDAEGAVQNLSFVYDSEFHKMAVSTKNVGTELTGFPALFDNLKSKVQQLATYWTARLFDPYRMIGNIKKIINVVKEYDSAMMEIRKVSQASAQEFNNIKMSSFDVGKQIGATGKDILSSVAAWKRLGKSLEESQEAAKASNWLLNVSEFTNIDDATKSLVSMTQAFDDLSYESAIDKLNGVGDAFSSSTDQIASGMQNVSSVLQVAGNNVDQSIALLAAANDVTQDMSKASMGVRTIALRIAGTQDAKQQLEDMGEDTSDFVVQTMSKVDAKVRNYTKTAATPNGISVLDDKGRLRDTYSILLDISKVWDDIVAKDNEFGTNTSNALLELLAGKTRSNVLASILQAPEVLEKAYETSRDSAGVGQRELDIYMDSIQAKTTQLTNSLQELANITINSEAFKTLLDVINALLSGVNALAKQFGVLNTVIGGIAGFALQRHGFGMLSTSRGAGWSNLLGGLFSGKPSTQLITKTFKPLDEAGQAFIAKWGDKVNQNGSFLEQYMGLTGATMQGIKNNSSSYFAPLINAVGEEKAMMMDYPEIMNAVSTGQVQVAVTAEKAAGAFSNLGQKFTSFLSGALTSVAVTAAITLAMKGLELLWTNVINWEETAIKRGQEAQKTITDLKDAFNKKDTFVDENLEEYLKLREGTATTKEGGLQNVSLDSESYEKFLSLNKEIAELFPSLVSTYDANGNALLTLSSNADTATESLKALVEQERMMTEYEIGENLPAVATSAAIQIKNATEEMDKYTQRADAIRSLQQLIDSNTGEDLNFSALDLGSFGISDDLRTFSKQFDTTDTNTREYVYSLAKIYEDAWREAGVSLNNTARQETLYDSDTGEYIQQETYQLMMNMVPDESQIKKFQQEYSTRLAQFAKHDLPEDLVESIVKANAADSEIKATWNSLVPSLISQMTLYDDYRKLGDTSVGAQLQQIISDDISNMDYMSLNDSDKKRFKTETREFLRERYLDPIIDAAKDSKGVVQEEVLKQITDTMTDTSVSRNQWRDNILRMSQDLFDGDAVAAKNFRIAIGVQYETKDGRLIWSDDEGVGNLSEITDIPKYALSTLSKEDLDLAVEASITGKFDFEGDTLEELQQWIDEYKEATNEVKEIAPEGILAEIFADEEYSSKAEGYEKSLTSLTGALETIRTEGKLTAEQMRDLQEEFPDLTDFSEESIGNVALKELTGWVDEFKKHIDTLSPEGMEQLQTYVDNLTMSFGDLGVSAEEARQAIVNSFMQNVDIQGPYKSDAVQAMTESAINDLQAQIEESGQEVNWQIVWELAMMDRFSDPAANIYDEYKDKEFWWEVHVDYKEAIAEIERDNAKIQAQISGQEAQNAFKTSNGGVLNRNDYDNIVSGKKQLTYNAAKALAEAINADDGTEQAMTEIANKRAAYYQARTDEVETIKQQEETILNDATKRIAIAQAEAAQAQQEIDAAIANGTYADQSVYSRLANAQQMEAQAQRDLADGYIELSKNPNLSGYADEYLKSAADAKASAVELDKSIRETGYQTELNQITDLSNAYTDLQSNAAKTEEQLNSTDTKRQKTTTKLYDDLIKNGRDQIDNLKQQRIHYNNLKRAAEQALDLEGARNYQSELDNIDSSIASMENDIIGWSDTMTSLVSTNASELSSVLSSAFSEINSETGLTIDTMNELERQFSDLAGVDISTIFYQSADGMKMNVSATEELVDAEYQLQQAQLNTVIAQQQKVLADDNATAAAKRNAQERINEAQRELSMLQALYDEQKKQFSRLSKFQQAQQTENGGANFETMQGYLDTQKENRTKGLTGTDEFKAYTEYFDRWGLNTIQAWDRNKDKVERYLTEDVQGVINFMDDVVNAGFGTKEGNNYNIDYSSLSDLAAALGISEEWTRDMFGRAEDYGLRHDWIESELDGHLKIKEAINNQMAAQEKYNQMLKEGASQIELDEQAQEVQYYTDRINNLNQKIQTLEDHAGQISLGDVRSGIKDIEKIGEAYAEAKANGVSDEDLQEYLDQAQAIADKNYLKFKGEVSDFEIDTSNFPELDVEVNPVLPNGIDLLHRPQITAEQMWAAGYTQEKGYDIQAGDIATVFSHTFTNNEERPELATQAVVVTPILPDGRVLSPEELEDYAQKLLAGEEIDEAIELKMFDGENVLEQANTYGEALHQVQAMTEDEIADIRQEFANYTGEDFDSILFGDGVYQNEPLEQALDSLLDKFDLGQEYGKGLAEVLKQILGLGSEVETEDYVDIPKTEKKKLETPAVVDVEEEKSHQRSLMKNASMVDYAEEKVQQEQYANEQKPTRDAIDNNTNVIGSKLDSGFNSVVSAINGNNKENNPPSFESYGTLGPGTASIMPAEKQTTVVQQPYNVLAQQPEQIPIDNQEVIVQVKQEPDPLVINIEDTTDVTIDAKKGDTETALSEIKTDAEGTVAEVNIDAKPGDTEGVASELQGMADTMDISAEVNGKAGNVNGVAPALQGMADIMDIDAEINGKPGNVNGVAQTLQGMADTMDITADVDGEAGNVNGVVDDLQGMADAMDVTTDIDGEPGDVEGALSEMQSEANANPIQVPMVGYYAEGAETPEIEAGTVDVTADNSKVIAAAQEAADAAGSMSGETSIDADTSGYDAKSSEVKQDLQALDGTTVAPSVNVSGNAETTLSSIDSQLNSLNGKEVVTRVVTEHVDRKGSDLGGQNNGGLSFVKGNAFVGGKDNDEQLSTKYNGGTLVGEEAPEMHVSRDGGYWQIVGQDGPEFRNDIAPGDIVFNAEQTRRLLRNGHINSRGKALAGGTQTLHGFAYKGGLTGQERGSATIELQHAGEQIKQAASTFKDATKAATGSTKAATSAKDKETDATESATTALDKFSQYVGSLYDWIEVRIKRFTHSMELAISRAENIGGSFKGKQNAYNGELTGYQGKNAYINEAMTENEKLYDTNKRGEKRYMKQASTIMKKAKKLGLVNGKQAKKYTKLIQNGAISIEELKAVFKKNSKGKDTSKTESNIKTVVDAYTTWYEKMLDCQSAQEECIAKNKELAQTKLDNITEEYENLIGFAESVRASSEAMVKYYGAVGKSVNGPETMSAIQNQIGIQGNISAYLSSEVQAYKAELEYAAQVFGTTSNEYVQAATKLQEMQTALTESDTALLNLNEQIRDLNFKPIEFAMQKLQSFGKRLESILNLNQKRSIYPKEEDINKQISNNNAMIDNAWQQYMTARNYIINNDWNENNEDEYQKWIKILREAGDEVITLQATNEDLKVSILDARWKSFDDLHEKIARTIDDFEWLGKQIKDSQIFDDDGQGWNLTAKGAAAIAMIGETMGNHKKNIVDFNQKLKDLDEQLANNEEMADVINERIEETIQKIKDESDALEDNKNKLIDYYKTGIQNENEALQKNIQLRSEALSKQKEYNDYAKQLQNQNRDRNKILAQINALQGNSNLQARAEVARLREQLYEADRELSDTKKNHRYDLLSEGYSKLAEDANETLDKTLRAVDANSDMQERIVNNMLNTIKTNYKDAYSSINDIISKTGVAIHNTTREAIKELSDATSALDVYSNAVVKTLETPISPEAANINTDKIQASTDWTNAIEGAVIGDSEAKIQGEQQNAAEARAAAEAERQRQEAEAQRQKRITELNDSISYYERSLDDVNRTIPDVEKNRDASYMEYVKYSDKAKGEKDKKKKNNYNSKANTHFANYDAANKQLSDLDNARSNYIKILDDLHRELDALNSYKKGIGSTLGDELAWTHQGEIIRRSDGAILRQLPAGTQVIPKVASENLLKWAQIDPFKELKEGFTNASSITNTNNGAPIFYYDSIIHIDGNVDADMMDRVEQLGKALLSSGNFQRGVVQQVTKEYKREFNKRY